MFTNDKDAGSVSRIPSPDLCVFVVLVVDSVLVAIYSYLFQGIYKQITSKASVPVGGLDWCSFRTEYHT
jgi:hypothetical protein